MRIISKNINRECDERLLSTLAPLSNILFLDIETTGLSAVKNRIYLIGCICRQADGWTMTQWFDNTGVEEKVILSSFLVFVAGYKCIVHYNGDRFDLPFLKKRLAVHSLPDPLEEMDSVDLYKSISPYKRLLALPDYRQQTLEALLTTGRAEDAPGSEMVRLYNTYIVNPVQDLMNRILEHNEADVTGLLTLVSLLRFSELADPHIRVYRAQANAFQDYNGSQQEEIFLYFRLQSPLPAPVYAHGDHCFLKIDKEEGILKIPLYSETMKYFYANYKDYYFLPEEDMAVHKYIAQYVDRGHRVQAKPETCYTRKAGSFLPEWDLFRTPFFKRAYADRDLFFEFTDDMKRDRKFLTDYASYVMGHIISASREG